MRDERGMPIPLQVKNLNDVLKDEPQLMVRGEWICLNVQPNVAWPVRPQSVDFAGLRIWIMPITSDCYPGVAVLCAPEVRREQAEGVLYRFLSVISWQERCGIVVEHRSGGNLPRMVGKGDAKNFIVRDVFDLTDLICPEDEEAQIALALIREARGLNHIGYAFLSYWRVLELAFPQPPKRIAWMEKVLPTLRGQGVAEALTSIAALGVTDVCLHLRDSGRCAIAHASTQPIINPDNPRDAERLYRELPLVREMAVRAVEERFEIDSPSTEFQKHLYELRGWKERLGVELVARLLADDYPEEGKSIDMPPISVRLSGTQPYPPFEGFRPKAVGAHAGGLDLRYGTSDGLFELGLRLAFSEERLQFDITRDLRFHDDGSVTAAQYNRELHRFVRDYYLNGVLHIWDADTGKLLSRKNPFVPLNSFVDLDACNAKIAEAEVEVVRRIQRKPT